MVLLCTFLAVILVSCGKKAISVDLTGHSSLLSGGNEQDDSEATASHITDGTNRENWPDTGTAVTGSDNADSGAAQEQASASASDDNAEKNDFNAVVLDAAMHSIVLQSEQGHTLMFELPDDLDTSGIASTGIVIGEAVEVKYSGTIHGTDTSEATLTQITTSSKTLSVPADSFLCGGFMILGVENQDLQSVASECSFPMTLDGATIASTKEMKKLDREKVFTSELVTAVSGVNPFDLKMSEDGKILYGGTHGFVIQKSGSSDDAAWYVISILP